MHIGFVECTILRQVVFEPSWTLVVHSDESMHSTDLANEKPGRACRVLVSAISLQSTLDKVLRNFASTLQTLAPLA
jgi:hypothetical protein